MLLAKNVFKWKYYSCKFKKVALPPTLMLCPTTEVIASLLQELLNSYGSGRWG